MKLTDLVSSYITFKRSLGMRFRSDAGVLRAFCRALGDVELCDIKPGAVLAFLAGNGPVTAYWHHKYKVLSGFYRFAIPRGHTDTSPLPSTIPKCPPPMTPYVYSTQELCGLLAATDCLQTPMSPLQAATFRTLLLLLYGTGMRIGEALSLTLADVSLMESLITIHDAKFFKTRLVPTGPKLTNHLSAYKKQRCRLPLPAGEASAFLATRTGNALSYGRVNQLFQKVRKAAGIRREDEARYQPRLHDIRHTAAVHRIVAWYREGADVQRRLLQLSTYLGHVDIASTQRYLSMTPELLNEASARFEKYTQTEILHE